MAWLAYLSITKPSCGNVEGYIIKTWNENDVEKKKKNKDKAHFKKIYYDLQMRK